MTTATSSDQQGTKKLLPIYQSSEYVFALKIHAVERTEDGAVLTPADQGYGPFAVGPRFVTVYDPQPGMYYVVNRNGHKYIKLDSCFKDQYLHTIEHQDAAYREATQRAAKQLLDELRNTEHPPKHIDEVTERVSHTTPSGWRLTYEYNEDGDYQHIIKAVDPHGTTYDFWEWPNSDERADLILWPYGG